MEIPVTLTSWSFAFLPLAVLLLLMLGARWGVAEAGATAWLCAVVTAVAYFDMPFDAIGFESVKGTWSAVTVLYVVWASILVYEVTRNAGAYEPLRRGIERVMPDRLLQVLAFGWAFASFLQGVTGFGVPIAVCAPLLIGIGVRPLYAVIIPLVGHAWNNTFGTLSVAWLGLKEVVGMSPAMAAETALYASAFIWVVNLLGGVLVCWIFGKMRGVRHGWPAIAVLSGLQGGLTLVLSQWNDVLNGFIAGTAAFVAMFAVAALPRYRGHRDTGGRIFEPEADAAQADYRAAAKIQGGGAPGSGSSTAATMSVHAAVSPYYALLAITFAILLIDPIKTAFSALSVSISFPQTSTGLGFVRDAGAASFTPLTHAGTFLLLSALIAFWLFRAWGYIHKGGLSVIVGHTVDKAIPSTIAVIALVAMSNVMAGAGSIDVLAHGVAAATGPAYGFLALLVGGLGSFMTTSNLASNLLFGSFQSTTATATGLSTAAILGAQTAGAAAGNFIAPGNVLLGTTTTGIIGREGEVLRVTMPLFLAIVAVIGIACLLLA